MKETIKNIHHKRMKHHYLKNIVRGLQNNLVSYDLSLRMILYCLSFHLSLLVKVINTSTHLFLSMRLLFRCVYVKNPDSQEDSCDIPLSPIRRLLFLIKLLESFW